MSVITLLDGGVGQEIYKRAGKPNTPMWSAEVMLDQPELVEDVHKDFIRAGAKIIIINSYTSTPARLQRENKLDNFEKLQQQAYAVAASARANLQPEKTDVSIAACLPPLIGSYTTDDRSYDDLKKEYSEIVNQQASQVDLFVVETISNIREASAAVEAASPVGKPIVLSFTLSDENPGKLRGGEPVEETVGLSTDYPLSALLFNCSYPETITKGIELIDTPDIPFGGYANGFTSIDPLKPGAVVNELSARHDLDEKKYCDEVLKWVDKGGSIVGGCCEVGPSYIKYMADTLKSKGHTLTSLCA